MSTPASVGLLERDGDQAALRAAADPGALVIVEGAAGIGKTELVDVGARWADEQGVRVLGARGAELEREFPYGLIRQLLAPAVAALPQAERATLLEGRAAPAGAVLGGAPDSLGADRPARDQAWAVLEALAAVCGRLVRAGPLLLAVDDAHWADASLRCLAFLARHRRELALALLVATRPPERPQEADLLLELLGDPNALIVHPAPLSADAVATLLAAELGMDPEPEFVSACHRATGGTPLYVIALARELAERDVAPVAANAEHAASIGPRTLAATLLARVRRVAPAGADVARAVAVLGGEASPHRVARLAGIPPGAATDAADALAAAGVLRPCRPLDFVHPVVRATIADDLAAGEHSRMHAAAARLLREEGAPVDRVATHLLATDPAGDGQTVELLRAAAGGALAQGAPSSAVSFLRRALAEPPPAGRRPQLLLELGFAESYAGMAEAFEHLEQALELADDPAARASTAMALGRMLEIAGRAPDAYAVLDGAAREARAGGDPDQGVALEAAAVGAGILYEDTAAAAVARARDLRRRLAAAPRSVPASGAGTLAYVAATAGEPAAVVVELARHALEAHPRVLPEAPDRPPFYYHACAALMFCERYEEEARLLDASLEQARRLGARSHLVLLSIFRAWLNARRGMFDAVEEDAEVAFARPPAPRFFRFVSLAARLEALVARDELERAARDVEADWIVDDGSVMHALFLAARARLRQAELRPAEALADALEAGRRFGELQAPSPAVAPWRSDAAVAYLALDDTAAARTLVEQETRLAQAAGLPRAIGIAQRATGLVEGGDRGVGLLAEAAATLARTEAPVERARALADLGAALRRRGQRARARDTLAQALDLAHRHHAQRIAEHARRELRAAGARPRRPLLTGVDALTPSERRVAELAARGLMNAEIARQLFVTPRTVEGHLTQVYRKLDIGSRAELDAGTLENPSVGPR